MNIHKTVSAVVENSENYPKCVVSRAKEILKLCDESRKSSQEIRANYNDIWLECVRIGKRDRWRTLILREKFGRERVSEFVKLHANVVNCEDSVKKYCFWDTFKRLLKLVDSTPEQLLECLKFVESVNSNEVSEIVWINGISAKIIPEILLWKYINNR